MSKVYEYVTERIVKMMEKGVCPWKKTWTMNRPQNYNSGRVYKGINAFLLAFSEYKDPRFLTVNQLNKLGGKIKKGEKAWMVTYWNVKEKEVTEKDGSVKMKKSFMLLYFNVFNVEQTEGWTPKPLESYNNDTIGACEAVVKNLPEEPIINEGRPSYIPALDIVRMPNLSQFKSSEEYYSTLFHELTHWTGGKSRLNRIDSTTFGSEPYAKEELVAELGAAFLCNMTGIAPKTEENAAAYLSHWLKVLKNDPKLIVSAAGQAQKAVDWMTATPNADEAEGVTESKTDLVAV